MLSLHESSHAFFPSFERATADAAAAAAAAAAADLEGSHENLDSNVAGKRIESKLKAGQLTPLIAISGSVQVGYSAVLFYGYVGLVGLMLYACLRWWFKSKVSLAQVWCIYGRPTNFLLLSTLAHRAF